MNHILPCGLALGSNLGNREQNLRQALFSMRQAFGSVLCSPFYETEPQNCPPNSPAYLNAVAEISCEWEPMRLLKFCQNLERIFGRIRTGIYGEARPLDVDILYMGGTILQSTELILPHPRAHLRRFVLKPLSDIRPHLVLPGQDADVTTLLATIQSDEPNPCFFSQS